jgi:hypothetical protein
MKNYFEAHLMHPDSTIPKEISLVLYHSCIATALLKHGERIASLDNGSLRTAWEHVDSLSWLDDVLRSIIRASLDRLRPGG